VGFIEGRQTDQAVNATLSAEVPEGVGSGDAEGNAFESGFLPPERVQYLCLEILAFCPAQIHAHEYLGKVLGIGAASPGVQGKDSRVTIMWTGQGQLELKSIQLSLDLPGLGFDSGGQRIILVEFGQLEKLQSIDGPGTECAPAIYFGF
jgi:hypothetical protein